MNNTEEFDANARRGCVELIMMIAVVVCFFHGIGVGLIALFVFIVINLAYFSINGFDPKERTEDDDDKPIEVNIDIVVNTKDNNQSVEVSRVEVVESPDQDEDSILDELLGTEESDDIEEVEPEEEPVEANHDAIQPQSNSQLSKDEGRDTYQRDENFTDYYER